MTQKLRPKLSVSFLWRDTIGLYIVVVMHELRGFNLFLVILSDVVKREIEQDPLLWSVADVASYITSVGFPEQALAFRTQVSAGVNQICQEHKSIF